MSGAGEGGLAPLAAEVGGAASERAKPVLAGGVKVCGGKEGDARCVSAELGCLRKRERLSLRGVKPDKWELWHQREGLNKLEPLPSRANELSHEI